MKKEVREELRIRRIWVVLEYARLCGNALFARFERNARNWDYRFSFYQISPTYRADNGFESGNNQIIGIHTLTYQHFCFS